MNPQRKENITRAERPDKALFYAMMGGFFILFSLPAFYWANYSYENYSRTVAVERQLREAPEALLTPNQLTEKKNRIALNASRAGRYKLEMILSGTGGLLLSCVSLLLWRKAWRIRHHKNLYPIIESRQIAKPLAPIEVQYSNAPKALFIGVAGFFVLTGSLISFQALNSQSTSLQEIIAKGAFAMFILTILVLTFFLLLRAQRQAVQVIDMDGVTRGDGRRLNWTEFCGVLTQTARNRFGKTYVWREELIFANGEAAWLIPQLINNREEVFNYIAQLRAKHAVQ
jgi:hypothetical protein